MKIKRRERSKNRRLLCDRRKIDVVDTEKIIRKTDRRPEIKIEEILDWLCWSMPRQQKTMREKGVMKQRSVRLMGCTVLQVCFSGVHGGYGTVELLQKLMTRLFVIMTTVRWD